jgi:hypothetical protein
MAGPDGRQMCFHINALGLVVGEKRDRVILTDKHNVEIFGTVHVAHGVEKVEKVEEI